nr:hypothetical protein [Pseudomonas cichorii]
MDDFIRSFLKAKRVWGLGSSDIAGADQSWGDFYCGILSEEFGD